MAGAAWTHILVRMATNKLNRSRASTNRRLRRGNPGLREEIHDPYRSTAKSRSPARCPECGATYLRGRWTWEKLPAAAKARLRCPACRRIDDRVPAGLITLSGAFVAAHEREALRLVRNVEKSERQDHALHRIMSIRREAGKISIDTTDVHLPRRIGHALEDAWGGSLRTHYDEEGCFARVDWVREE
jgi:hypothetical protein